MTNVVLRLSRSQHMALLDVLLEHIRRGDGTQLFIDCSTGTETSTGELLQLISDSLREVELTDPTMDWWCANCDAFVAPTHIRRVYDKGGMTGSCKEAA